MSTGIKIVTDSTSDLPAEIVAKYGIAVVPARINIGNSSYADGVDMTRDAFYKSLPSLQSAPQTSACAPGVLAQAYRNAAVEGKSEVLSLHVASELSAFVEAATVGSEMVAELPVTVFDSKSVSLGLGMQVIYAAEMVEAGLSIPEILVRLASVRERTYVYAGIDSLTYLRRSGRVNLAQFSVGNLLNVKPVLQVHFGAISVVGRVRTRRGTLSKLSELFAAHRPVERYGIVYSQDIEPAHALANALHQHEVGPSEMSVNVTPAIGTHSGPGAVGFVCVSAE